MSTPLTLNELELDLIAAKLCGLDRTEERYWVVSQCNSSAFWSLFSPDLRVHGYYSEAYKLMTKEGQHDNAPFTWYYFRTEAEAKEFYDSKTSS